MLSNKTILVISPQSWGNMLLSKHHYAICLAAKGNTVFFLNPPDQAGGSDRNGARIRVTPSEAYPGLFLVDHHLAFPYNIKFHFIWLFHQLMKQHVKQILQALGVPVDIIWSFDLGHFYPFSFFPDGALRIFHPVDEPLNDRAIMAAGGADIIFSVTHEILEKYKDFEVQRHFINHGVAEMFFRTANIRGQDRGSRKVGISGNLTRRDIDRPTVLKIITGNPDITFECFGSYEVAHSNIGGSDDPETVAFIGEMKKCANVRLNGVLPAHALAEAYSFIDAFLICYDIQKDQSKGTNYHKVMEFLATGKVVISNNITTYQGLGLIEMTKSRVNNELLPSLFRKVMDKLGFYNSGDLVQKRVNYATANTYDRQVEQIGIILQSAGLLTEPLKHHAAR